MLTATSVRVRRAIEWGLLRTAAVRFAGMTQQITAGEFHAADDVEDWRCLYHLVSAHFRTESEAQASRALMRSADSRAEPSSSTLTSIYGPPASGCPWGDATSRWPGGYPPPQGNWAFRQIRPPCRSSTSPSTHSSARTCCRSGGRCLVIARSVTTTCPIRSTAARVSGRSAWMRRAQPHAPRCRRSPRSG